MARGVCGAGNASSFVIVLAAFPSAGPTNEPLGELRRQRTTARSVFFFSILETKNQKNETTEHDERTS